MTQIQLDCAIADVTGESLDLVHDLGFSLPGALEPEDLCLVLDCPFCRRPVPFPGRVRGGALAQAECLRLRHLTSSPASTRSTSPTPPCSPSLLERRRTRFPRAGTDRPTTRTRRSPSSRPVPAVTNPAEVQVSANPSSGRVSSRIATGGDDPQCFRAPFSRTTSYDHTLAP